MFIDYELPVSIINNIVSLYSDLCLEAAARFISYQRKCYFSSSEAENILQVGRFFQNNVGFFRVILRFLCHYT